MPMRFWAVGLKGWVQIRSGNKPPRPITSSSLIPLEQQQGGYFDYWSQRWEGGFKVKSVFKLEQVVFEGGRVIYTLPTRRFNRLTKLRVKKDEVVEVGAGEHLLAVLRKERQCARTVQAVVAAGGRRE